MSSTSPDAVVVLAAGEGTRMKSAIPKVLHAVCGRSLVGHVLVAARGVSPQHLVVVVGHGRDQVVAHLGDLDPAARAVVQEEQNGTGHATRIALKAVPGLAGTVVVVPGDSPLLTTETLEALTVVHEKAGNVATVLSAVVPDPAGYGRILRNTCGEVTSIVEDKDASREQRAVTEVNSGVYAFDAALLLEALGRLTSENVQQEEYLTDVLGILTADGHPVGAVTAEDYREILGCNDRVQLAQLSRIMRDRIVERWMRDGVTAVDPETTWLDVQVVLEPDAVIHPNVQLQGFTHVARNAEVGPNCTLRDTYVGTGAVVTNAVCVSSEIGPEAHVGPFTYLRPGTRLGRGAKAGSYVELKAADVGDDSKVPHLSYVGDATIGVGSNIGAATVFVNYDGRHKHRTMVGNHVRIGSDTMLVAPITVGDGAYTAAGSVITEDVPPGAMGVGRARQRNIDGWVERKRPGTSAAQAASRARGSAAVGDTGDGDVPEQAANGRRSAASPRPGETQ